MMVKCRYVFRLILFITFLGIILLFPGIVSSSQTNIEKFSAKVIYIIDGDTFEIKEMGKSKKVRLWGIDTPEWDQPYSDEAKYFLIKKLLNKKITIQPLYHDKFGRLIAIVVKEGENINQLLVEKGYAWVHIYYCKKKICNYWKKLERNAKLQGIGLWSRAHPVAPWKWKRK